MLTLTGSNGFSGPVTFSCSGLPTGATCGFNPASIALSGTGSATVTLSIATAAPAPPAPSPYLVHSLLRRVLSHPGITFTFLGPFCLIGFAGLRRKSILARGSLLVLALAALSLGLSGCSSSTSMQPPGTPQALNAQVTVNATAGAISHSVTVAVKVQ
jgi:hypothetical protein